MKQNKRVLEVNAMNRSSVRLSSIFQTGRELSRFSLRNISIVLENWSSLNDTEDW